MEFRASVIKRRDAQEHIVSTRFVVLLFHLCSLHQTDLARRYADRVIELAALEITTTQ